VGTDGAKKPGINAGPIIYDSTAAVEYASLTGADLHPAIANERYRFRTVNG
jgi:hypothetical protein